MIERAASLFRPFLFRWRLALLTSGGRGTQVRLDWQLAEGDEDFGGGRGQSCPESPGATREVARFRLRGREGHERGGGVSALLGFRV